MYIYIITIQNIAELRLELSHGKAYFRLRSHVLLFGLRGRRFSCSETGGASNRFPVRDHGVILVASCVIWPNTIEYLLFSIFSQSIDMQLISDGYRPRHPMKGLHLTGPWGTSTGEAVIGWWKTIRHHKILQLVLASFTIFYDTNIYVHLHSFTIIYFHLHQRL